MTIVDSCGWMEYFADGPNASFFSEPIQNATDMIVPSIVLYELWKKISQEQGEERATEIVAQLKRYDVISLDENLAISAAAVSNKYKIPMADSIVYATAQKYNASIWTQDSDFEGLKGVKFKAKPCPIS